MFKTHPACVDRRHVSSMLIIAAMSGGAFAQTTLFDDRGLWTAAAGAPIAIETFESAVSGFLTPPTTFGSGLTAGLASGNVRMLIEAGDPDNVGFVNTTPAGANYLRYSISDPDDFDTGTYTVRFDVPELTTAFGFDISSWAPLVAADGTLGQGGTTITLFDGQQIVDEFFLQSDNAGDLLFLGLTNMAGFDQVRMSIAVFPPLGGISQSDDIAFDDVSWAVPAPTSAAIFGLGGLFAARRRR